MEKQKRRISKVVSLLSTLLMLCGILLCSAPTVSADDAGYTKTRKSYEIAVAYDNSGSMYAEDFGKPLKAWSRAKYAMEVFASMLDYESGDRLTIYPMWPVSVNEGKTGKVTQVTIDDIKDIDQITYMYTPSANGTPYKPVDEAYNALKNSKADEKWLIVLTDGLFNAGDEPSDIRGDLIGKAKSGINVQYLGFADAADLKADTKNKFYSVKCNDTNLMSNLIDICNTIFERNILSTEKYLSGKKLTLDISMKTLIVFIQGKGAGITSLSSSDGDVSIRYDSGQRKYSDVKYSAIHYYNQKDKDPVKSNVTDTTLYGQAVTFNSCKAGEYTLNYKGDEDASIQIFYEPDVVIKAELLNSDGQAVNTDTDKLYTGEYTISAYVADAKTGERIEDSELLGDVDIKIYTKYSTENDYTEHENNCKVELRPDDEFETYVEATYLEKYKVSTRDLEGFELGGPFRIVAPIPGFEIALSGQEEKYTVVDRNKWKPLKITVTLQDKPLTPEQFKGLELDPDIIPDKEKYEDFSYRIVEAPNESAYYIYLAQDKDGNFVRPKNVGYTFKFRVEYTNDQDESAEDYAECAFKFEGYPLWWAITFWSLLFLLLLLIWIFYMTRKVLPKRVDKNPDGTKIVTMSAGDLPGSNVRVTYNRKRRELNIATQNAVQADERCNASFKIRPVDNRFTRSKDRGFNIVSINSNCPTVIIKNTEYVKVKNQFVKSTLIDPTDDNPKIVPIDQSAKNGVIELVRGYESTLTCQLKNFK